MWAFHELWVGHAQCVYAKMTVIFNSPALRETRLVTKPTFLKDRCHSEGPDHNAYGSACSLPVKKRKKRCSPH